MRSPCDVVFGDGPFGGPDYQTHYQHTHTLQGVIAEFGHAWAYDPDLLAGHPTGLIFDVDNKLHFGFTMLLRGLGAPLHVAFNLFTLLSSLLAPLSLWLAARLLGHTRPAQLVAFALGTLAWNFDPTTRFCWGGGMVSFATAAHVCAVVVAVMFRLMREGGKAVARGGAGGAVAAGPAHARVELRGAGGAADGAVFGGVAAGVGARRTCSCGRRRCWGCWPTSTGWRRLWRTAS
jgi:hypothetical protein